MHSINAKGLPFVIFIVALLSCKDNRVQKISLSSKGCLGECPQFAIEIDQSLNCKYYGGMFAENEGFFEGKVESNIWEDLQTKFGAFDYSKIKDRYDQSYDGLELDMVITVKGEKKHIGGQMGDMPKDLQEVVSDLTKTIMELRLPQIKDSLKFECQAYPRKVSNVKFLPEDKIDSVPSRDSATLK